MTNLFESDQVYIIAELSANHNHNKEVAIQTIKAAKKAGANAVKLQTYTADTLTINCYNEYFKIKDGLWKGKTLYELYSSAYTPWEWHAELFQVARDEDITCFSTPFDITAVDFLEELENPIYKIASFEIQDISLIEYAASKMKPMLISTGIAEFEDIELAVEVCRSVGNKNITLLKCTSAYPAPIEEANLLTIKDLRDTFNLRVGLSDHTLGITAPVVATALGAKVVEKHFIIDRSIGGPDSAFSLDFEEFALMVKAVRKAECAIGEVNYNLSDKVIHNKIFSRSLFAVQDIKAGEKFTTKNIRSIRPGSGMHPKYFKDILGLISKVDIQRGTPLKREYIQE